ncbi:Outer membrane efflux protein BepC [Alteripontixanthobacter maritimus]|uniref:Outer membrane efflux protein BepC n=1 Tax=Alteripontixanthobacter maritimus TaxID=2161824 RepID=A0A369Q9Z1_9SPHN|nr:TolC family outer membrane protein [Alteripontixanthobacter maritimus]RDC61170.1 Outer membrane efflux protein BepC [Alteripontixanthobacter maritimus]
MLRGTLLTIAGLAAGSALVPASASADTLREALAQAYRTNPVLAGARAQQRGTDENVVIEKSRGRPSVDATADYIEFVKQASTSFTAPERSVGTGLDLGVPLYSGGAVKNAVRAAETRVAAGQAELRATESSLFSQVVAAYMNVIGQEAIVGLSANQVDVLAVNLDATGDRFEIGILTRTDVAQSASRLALAQGDLQSARANLISARENYIQLVGEAPTNLQPPPPLPGLPATVGEAVLIALESNPDLIAAIERAEAAGIDIRVAGAGRLPRVSLFAGGNYNNFLGTLGGSGGGVAVNPPQGQTSAQVGVRLSVPLLQGGLTAARERQASAFASAALEQVIAVERDVIGQVRSSWSSWQAALAIIDSSQSAVDAAELSLEGVRAENTVGNRTVLDILDAEQELLGSRVQLVTARRNAYVAGFSLLAAMGRAEARDLGLFPGEQLYDPQTNYEAVRGKWWDWERTEAPTTTGTSTVDIPAPDAEIPGEIQGPELDRRPS